MTKHSEAADTERSGGATALISLINSVWMSRAVFVAAELRIADVLAGGPKSVDELARATDCHSPSLHRFMRALVSLALCSELDDGSFELAPLGVSLRADAPDSVRSLALWSGRYLWPLWGSLLQSVKTGRSARSLVAGIDGFDDLEHDEEAATVFNRAMLELTRLVARQVTHAYDFAEMRRIVDIGGGYGALLAAVLEAYPDAHGVLYDRPHAIEGARAHLASAGLANRCELVGGSFFESVPVGADAYLLKSIVHDWDDERSVDILRSCRRGIPPSGKLLLVERMMPERFEASPRHRLFAQMELSRFVGHGGRQRTEAEFRTLLDLGGFMLTRIVPTASEFNILEGVPR
jgi:hypothetical protein